MLLWELMVVHNRWLNFLIWGLNLKFSLFIWLLDLNLIEFVPWFGILIVRECQNTFNCDKSLHSNSYFFVTTGLIYSTIVDFEKPLLLKYWVEKSIPFLHWSRGSPTTQENLMKWTHLDSQPRVSPKLMTSNLSSGYQSKVFFYFRWYVSKNRVSMHAVVSWWTKIAEKCF